MKAILATEDTAPEAEEGKARQSVEGEYVDIIEAAICHEGEV